MAKQHAPKAADYAPKPPRCGHSYDDFESCDAIQGGQHCIKCKPNCVGHSGKYDYEYC